MSRILFALYASAAMAALVGVVSLAAHTAHIWPGMVAVSVLTFVSVMASTRRWPQ